MPSAQPFVAPSTTPSTKARAESTMPSASTENPNAFGSWATTIASAMPLR